MSETIFEKTQQGQFAYSLPESTPEFEAFSPKTALCRQEPLLLPEISELDLMRHFSSLAHQTVGIDNVFYPLGSCTMKFNPRINEWAAHLPGFLRTHPLAPPESVQGNLSIVFELLKLLSTICGMSAGTLLPNAGAQGEFTGMQMIARYHQKQHEEYRTEVLIPDNAHGTNPATATMVGMKTISIRTNKEGDIDLDHLKMVVSNKTAALMMTNPNTLGLFSPFISEIAEIIHSQGGLLYYDGANLNPLLNIVRPGEMGFDVMHINLHKTFSTPHGGGGPGSGPVLCNEKLKEFLPVPRVEKRGDFYQIIWEDEKSIGQIASFHGNFGIYLRAYLYIKLLGQFGLRRVAEQSVLNANYLKKMIGKYFTIPFPQPCMHEFVIQVDNYLDQGIRAYDIAKRMLDYGIHPPTIYFPLIIKECMLIEPTECESKKNLDEFINTVQKIVNEIYYNSLLIKEAPHTTAVSKLDEALAARQPILKASLELCKELNS